MADLWEHPLPPNTIVSWMWCFNLSELRWHVSNKWFLGAAVHTRSNSRTSLDLNDWFLDFRLSGCASEGSCQPPKCMKLYYAAHFENVCITLKKKTDKKSCKTWGEETKGAKKISCLFFFFFLWNHVCFLQSKESSYWPHFPLVFVLLGHRQSLSQQQERVSLTASQTKWRH